MLILSELIPHVLRKTFAIRAFGQSPIAMCHSTLDNALDRAEPECGVQVDHLDLDEWLFSIDPFGGDLMKINWAIDLLEINYQNESEIAASIIFGGMTIDEASIALDVNPETAWRRWHFARRWLYLRVSDID